MATEQIDAIPSLWPEGALRAFVSHTHHSKELAGKLQSKLQEYGISCFVAHENIEPLKDWDDELMRALKSMHVLIALVTSHFQESPWTDQEVGIAIGREVPVVPVHLGVDPYGFVGRIQALKQNPQGEHIGALASNMFRLFLKHENITLSSCAKDAYVRAVSEASSYARANNLADFLKSLDTLTPAQAKGLVDAFNDNGQVYGSYGFKGRLIPELERLTKCHYEMVKDNGRKKKLQSVDLDIAYHFD